MRVTNYYYSQNPTPFLCATINAGTHYFAMETPQQVHHLTLFLIHSYYLLNFCAFMVSDCFSQTSAKLQPISKASSTTVGSPLSPVGFCRLICPSLAPLGCQARQVPVAVNNRSDTDVARLRGRLLRDLRAQEFPPRNSRLLPRFGCCSTLSLDLALDQYAAVGSYPTHVLLELK